MDGFDEGDEPVFSQPAVERAVSYAELLDRLGHDRAVVTLWGEGCDLPAPVVLNALQARYAEEVKQANAFADGLGTASGSTRLERKMAGVVRARWPDAANHLRAYAQGEAADEQSYPARMSEKRADAIAVMLTQMATGEGEGALDEVLPMLGYTAAAGRAIGIGVSAIEQLAMVGRCIRGEISFVWLVEIRDAFRHAFLKAGLTIRGDEARLLVSAVMLSMAGLERRSRAASPGRSDRDELGERALAGCPQGP